MDLVEVDILRAQAAEAVFDLLAEPCGGQVGEDAAVVPIQANLGSDVEGLAAAVSAHGLADDLLGAPVAVDGRGVDEVDAALDGAQAGGDGYFFGDRAPVQSADGPGAQADAGYFHAGNRCSLHIQYLKRSFTRRMLV